MPSLHRRPIRESTYFTVDGKFKVEVVGSVGESKEIQSKIKKEDWNEYHVTAKGFTFTHQINGVVTSICNDEDQKERRAKGVLALQLHAGPPMKVQFRNIKLKTLKPEAAASGAAAKGKKKALLLAISLFWIGVPYFLIGFTHNYVMLLVCVMLVGIGNNLWHPAAIPTLASRFPDRKGLVLSIHGMGGNVGSQTATIVVRALATGEVKPGEFIHTLGDAHLYLNHIEQANLQLSRAPHKLPVMINFVDRLDVTASGKLARHA